MSIDPGFAAWLKQDALYAISAVAGASAAWGDKAISSTVVSPLANESDAQTIADAQAAFMAGPLAQDKVVVAGHRKDLIGQCITVTGDRLGYEAGAAVFVIGAAEADPGSTTTLTVLKRTA